MAMNDKLSTNILIGFPLDMLPRHFIRYIEEEAYLAISFFPSADP